MPVINRPPRPKPTISKPAPVPADAKRYTDEIEFLGVGTDEDEKLRFLKVAVGDKSALLSAKQLVVHPKSELARLEELGVPLIFPKAQNEFIRRAHDEARKPPTLRVATKVGLLHGNGGVSKVDPAAAGVEDFDLLPVVVFPDGAVPPEAAADVELYFDERYDDVHRKFHRAGTREGWKELLDLCKGNSRLIYGFALSFTGLPCAAFGLDPPGVQFLGRGGCGKTPAARTVSSVWGWDFSTRLGFGTSWNTKLAALDVTVTGCNNFLLFLDEMSQAKADAVDAILRVMLGHGTARYTELHRLLWCTPVLSTSNTSVLALVRRLGNSADEASYIDRLMDVPPPDGCDCYFEDLHGARDVAQYCGWMDALAEQHHGRAGYSFASEFARALRTDRDGWKAFFLECCDEYVQKAEGIRATGRDLSRVHGRNATIYAAGRLATRFGVFPVAAEDLLKAVLTCERDHVAFVAKEQGAARAMLRAPFDRLRDYLTANKVRFADVQDPEASLPEDHDHELLPRLHRRPPRAARVLADGQALRRDCRREVESKPSEGRPPGAGPDRDRPAGRQADFRGQAADSRPWAAVRRRTDPRS